jgi:flagellar secretion chaperone FliS
MSSVGLSRYNDVSAYGRLTDASPHKVIQQMLDTLLTRLAEAEGRMQRGETAAKSQAIGKALAIVEGLAISLDSDRGGEIAANLQRLYEYMSTRLVQANLENRVELVVEVASLVGEIKAGWDAIAEAGAR